MYSSAKVTDKRSIIHNPVAACLKDDGSSKTVSVQYDMQYNMYHVCASIPCLCLLRAGLTR